jgi:hypothetical protein
MKPIDSLASLALGVAACDIASDMAPKEYQGISRKASAVGVGGSYRPPVRI